MTAAVISFADARLIQALRSLCRTKLEAELLASRVRREPSNRSAFSLLVALGNTPEAAAHALAKAGMVSGRDETDPCARPGCKRRIGKCQRVVHNRATQETFCSDACFEMHARRVDRG